jgi:hypothetical protein
VCCTFVGVATCMCSVTGCDRRRHLEALCSALDSMQWLWACIPHRIGAACRAGQCRALEGLAALLHAGGRIRCAVSDLANGDCIRVGQSGREMLERPAGWHPRWRCGQHIPCGQLTCHGLEAHAARPVPQVGRYAAVSWWVSASARGNLFP